VNPPEGLHAQVSLGVAALVAVLAPTVSGYEGSLWAERPQVAFS
jgi:hypothetical protein